MEDKKDLTVRLRAASIRKKFAAHHAPDTPVMLMLNSMTDAEIVAKADENHRAKMEYLAHKKEKKQ